MKAWPMKCFLMICTALPRYLAAALVGCGTTVEVANDGSCQARYPCHGCSGNGGGCYVAGVCPEWRDRGGGFVLRKRQCSHPLPGGGLGLSAVVHPGWGPELAHWCLGDGSHQCDGGIR